MPTNQQKEAQQLADNVVNGNLDISEKILILYKKIKTVDKSKLSYFQLIKYKNAIATLAVEWKNNQDRYNKLDNLVKNLGGDVVKLNATSATRRYIKPLFRNSVKAIEKNGIGYIQTIIIGVVIIAVVVGIIVFMEQLRNLLKEQQVSDVVLDDIENLDFYNDITPEQQEEIKDFVRNVSRNQFLRGVDVAKKSAIGIISVLTLSGLGLFIWSKARKQTVTIKNQTI